LNPRKENRNHCEKIRNHLPQSPYYPPKERLSMNLALAALLLVVPAFAVSNDCWDARHFRSEMQREARELRREAFQARMEAHREALRARMDARQDLRRARTELRRELERVRQETREAAREEAREFRRSFFR
jgi:septal ring factor EnvC (AmiA/AmiB activator)